MSKLIVPQTKVRWGELYKGFFLNIKEIHGAYIGIALCQEEGGKEIMFKSGLKKTKNECGQMLTMLVDLYRKSDKQRLVITSAEIADQIISKELKKIEDEKTR